MPNKFTEIFSTKPVSSYRPLPIEQFASLSQGIRERFDQQQLMDARTRQALKKTKGMFTDPVLQEAAGQLVQNKLSELDEIAATQNPEDSLIETQLMAEDVSSSLQNFKNVEESKTQMVSNIRDRAIEAGLTPNEAELMVQQAGLGIQYDPESGVAALQGSKPTIVDRADPAEIITQRGGPEADQIFTIRDDGTVVTREGVDATKAQQLARNILSSSPEFRASQEQDAAIYAQQARNNDPQETLNSYMESLSSTDKEQAQQLVQEMRDSGMSDDQIYGQFRASENTANALNFAANRYAFIKDSAKNVPKQDDSSTGSKAMDALMKGVTVNNPHMVDKPEEIIPSETTSITDTEFYKNRLRELTESTGAVSEKQISATGLKERAKADAKRLFKESSIEELAKNESVVKQFGTAIQSLIDDNPREKGESDSEYKQRINNLYKEARSTMGSLRKGIKPINRDDFEGANSINRQLFGNPSDPRDLGLGTDLTYIITTPGEEAQALSSDQLAEKLGFDSTSELFDHMKAIAEFDENSHLTGWEMRVSTPGGILSDGKTYSIKGLADEVGDDHRKAKLAQIDQLRRDLGTNEPVEAHSTFSREGADEKVSGKVRIEPQNLYIKDGKVTDEGGKGARFYDRRLVITTKGGKKVYEDTSLFDQIVSGIQ